MRAWRCRSPSVPTCWRPDASFSPDPQRRSARMSPSADPISAISAGAGTMDGLIHQVLSGIATGGIYASVALALVMIYQATHHVNFAQGEMATFSTYIALTLIQAGLPYWVAFAATFVISFVMGVLIERIFMRPMANAPILSSVGVFIGLLLIFSSISGWIFGYTIKTFPSPFETSKPLLGG